MLVHFPAILVGTVLVAALGSFVAAAYPLLLSSSATGLLQRQISSPSITRYGMGMLYQSLPMDLNDASDGSASPTYVSIDKAFEDLAGTVDHLGPPIRTIMSPITPVSLADSPRRERLGRLFSGTIAQDQVSLVAGSTGPGALVPESIAIPLHIDPGDAITVSGTGDRAVTVPVAGIYRPLSRELRHGYWLAWDREIFPLCPTCPDPPQFIIIPREVHLAALRTLHTPTASFGWQAPVEDVDALTLEEARTLSAEIERVRTAIIADGTTTGDLFDCCQVFDEGFRHERRFRSYASSVTLDVSGRVASLSAPAALVDGIALAIVLLVTAAVGVAATRARHGELRYLDAHGVSALSIGGLRLAELAFPVSVGAFFGLGGAALFARALAHGGPIEPAAYISAVDRSSFIAALVLCVSLAPAMIAYRRLDQRSSSGRRLRAVPWEIATATLTAWTYLDIRSHGAFAPGTDSTIQHPRPQLVWVLLLGMLTASLVAARVGSVAFRFIRSRSDSLGPTLHLASHRLAGPTRSTAAAVMGTTLCLGVLLAASELGDSLDRTIDAKARVFVGSDAQVRVEYATIPPGDIRSEMTKITIVRHAGELAPGKAYDLIAIDSGSFAQAAYWNERFSDLPLASILTRLRSPIVGGLPVVAVGSAAPTSLEIGQTPTAVRQVATAEAFPGSSSTTPLYVVDEARLVQAIHGGSGLLATGGATTAYLLRGSLEDIQHDISSFGSLASFTVTAEQVMDIPHIEAAIRSFRVIRIVAAGSIILVLAGLFLYLMARERAEVVQLGLSLRMGMSIRGHRASTFVEVASILTLSLVVAVVPAVGGASVLVARLDPLRGIRPSPIEVVPILLTVWAAALIAPIAWGAASLATSRAGRVPLGEAMRTGE